MVENFHAQVSEFIEKFFVVTGMRPDRQLSGYPVAEAVPVDIDPALDAIVRTELLLADRMAVDLRELVNVAPPVEGDNLFITFGASSVNFQGGNATDFGIHLAHLPLTDEIQATFSAGFFVPEARVAQAYQLFVYLRHPEGDVNLAKTGVAIGLDPEGRLVSYLGYEIDARLAVTRINPPSRLGDADRGVMVYIFLALSAFMAVNQGEAPLRQEPGGGVSIG